MSIILFLALIIGGPFAVAKFRARWIEASIGLNRQISDALAPGDFERWERDLK